MLKLRNKFNFLIVIIFLSSCSSMNITEEKVYSEGVKTVEASSISENINYDNKAMFANATVYFEFDKFSSGNNIISFIITFEYMCCLI